MAEETFGVHRTRSGIKGQLFHMQYSFFRRCVETLPANIPNSTSTAGNLKKYSDQTQSFRTKGCQQIRMTVRRGHPALAIFNL